MYIKTVSFIMSTLWLSQLLTDRKSTLQSPKSHFQKTSQVTNSSPCLLHNIYDKSLPVYHADNYICTEGIDFSYFIYFLQSN